MQDVIGLIGLAAVIFSCARSAYGVMRDVEGMSIPMRILHGMLGFFFYIVAVFIIFSLAGEIFSAIAWILIKVLELLRWLIDGFLQPWHWMFQWWMK